MILGKNPVIHLVNGCLFNFGINVLINTIIDDKKKTVTVKYITCFCGVFKSPNT